MDCMEKETWELIKKLGESASSYGKVRRFDSGVYSGSLEIVIAMSVYADGKDIHDLRILKEIPRDFGYEVTEIATFENDETIQFVLKAN